MKSKINVEKVKQYMGMYAIEYNIINNSKAEGGGIKLNIIKNIDLEFFIDTYERIIDFMNTFYKLDLLIEEYAYVIGYDDAKIIKGIFQLSHGDSSKTIISIKELFKFLLLSNANKFVIIHNHPNQSREHSDKDLLIMSQISEASKIIGIDFVASIVISIFGYSIEEYTGWINTKLL